MKKYPLSSARYLLSATNPAQLPPASAEVAFVGRSNVGKSSVLNALCGQSALARVSQTPGRTRMINVFETAPGRWLVDLPGYGYAAGSISSREGWPAMIEGYLTSRSSVRCIFMLVDANVGATVLDGQMMEWLSAHALPYQILANKADRVKSSKQHAQQQLIAGTLHKPFQEIAWISAREGTGIAALRMDVAKLLDSPREDSKENKS